MEVKKIMEKETALNLINDIKNKICDVDLDELCGDEVEVAQGDSSVIFKKVVQAVQCGLVEWDEEEKCLTQTLIHPITSGTMKADKLFYKTNITLGDAKNYKTTNQAEIMINSIANVTGKATQLIEQLRGQDLNIAIGCLSFFDR